MKRLIYLLIVSLVVVTACQEQERSLTLATTTSTEDSGLLDVIVPNFEESRDITVEVVAVGTGAALALGRAGDADVVLVHAPALEQTFVEEGYGLDRRAVMANDFIILGPEEDPAGVSGMVDVVGALQQIKEGEATFVSRGDESGTHVREIELWQAAQIEPAGEWYLSVGQGMGATLTIAEEEQAYVLSDRGTYLKRQADGLDLQVHVEGDERLLNPYHIMLVNPQLSDNIHAEEARLFSSWITSPETQRAIGAYRLGGEQLFQPAADVFP